MPCYDPRTVNSSGIEYQINLEQRNEFLSSELNKTTRLLCFITKTLFYSNKLLFYTQKNKELERWVIEHMRFDKERGEKWKENLEFLKQENKNA